MVQHSPMLDVDSKREATFCHWTFRGRGFLPIHSGTVRQWHIEDGECGELRHLVTVGEFAAQHCISDLGKHNFYKHVLISSSSEFVYFIALFRYLERKDEANGFSNVPEYLSLFQSLG